MTDAGVRLTMVSYSSRDLGELPAVTGSQEQSQGEGPGEGAAVAKTPVPLGLQDISRPSGVLNHASFLGCVLLALFRL